MTYQQVLSELVDQRIGDLRNFARQYANAVGVERVKLGGAKFEIASRIADQIMQTECWIEAYEVALGTINLSLDSIFIAMNGALSTEEKAIVAEEEETSLTSLSDLIPETIDVEVVESVVEEPTTLEEITDEHADDNNTSSVPLLDGDNTSEQLDHAPKAIALIERELGGSIGERIVTSNDDTVTVFFGAFYSTVTYTARRYYAKYFLHNHSRISTHSAMCLLVSEASMLPGYGSVGATTNNLTTGELMNGSARHNSNYLLRFTHVLNNYAFCSQSFFKEVENNNDSPSIPNDCVTDSIPSDASLPVRELALILGSVIAILAYYSLFIYVAVALLGMTLAFGSADVYCYVKDDLRKAINLVRKDEDYKYA